VLSKFFSTIAWLLAAVWLPASQHCNLETTGWLDIVHCCGADSATSTDDAHDDLGHCATIQSGVPREMLDTGCLMVPVVAVLELLRPLLQSELIPVSNGVAPPIAAPPEIGGLWRIVQRVVAPPQAP
jgi:hypothetical protein